MAAGVLATPTSKIGPVLVRLFVSGCDNYRKQPFGVSWGFTPNRAWKPLLRLLTHWGRVTHICVSKLTIVVIDNGLSPVWCQAIIWTNAEIPLIEPLSLGTNLIEILTELHIFSLKENVFQSVVCEMVNSLSRPQCVYLVPCHLVKSLHFIWKWAPVDFIYGYLHSSRGLQQLGSDDTGSQDSRVPPMGGCCTYRQSLIQEAQNPKTQMFLVSSCSFFVQYIEAMC